MSSIWTRLSACVLFAACSGASSGAAAQEHVGDFIQFSVFTYSDRDGLACFVAAGPNLTEGSVPGRQDPTFFVTNWQKDGVIEEVSVNMGYVVLAGSALRIVVDGKEFSLRQSNADAWLGGSGTDLLAALLSAERMTVRGTSSRGRVETVDTYFLEGLDDALAAAREACRN
jgi:hypothetical protein